MKKRLLLSLIVLFSVLFHTTPSLAQCTNNVNFYPGAITATNTLNTAQTISTCNYTTEYSQVNGMLIGGVYQFTLTASPGYITVMTGPGGTGTVVAHGAPPLTVVATATTLYPHWNDNAACGGTSSCYATGVTLTAMPASCIQPISLNAANITTTTAFLSWGDANTTPAANYDVYNVLTSAPGPTSATVPTVSSTTDTTTLTGLLPSTTYDYYVRGRCSATDTSAWSGPFTYTTLATCLSPITLGASNITSGAADLTWTDPNATAAGNYDILLGLQGTLADPNITPQPVTIPGYPSTTFSLPGLPPNTCFDFYVRSHCSGTDSSTWAGPYSFCTLVSTLSCPAGSNSGIVFYEGFDAATATQTSAAVNITPIAGWSRNGNNATGAMNWRLDNNAGNSGGTGALSGHVATNTNPGYAMLETSSGPGFDTMFSKPVDLTTVNTAARTKFFYYMYGANVGSLTFLVKHASGVDSLWSISGQQHTNGSSPWDSTVIDLSSYIGQSIQLAWLGTNTAGCCSGDINVDEVEVEACLSCPAPTAVTPSNILATSFDLSWTENGSATLWDLEIVPAGTPPTGTPDSVGVTTNMNKNISGLASFQAYDVYVRSSCSATDSSTWTGPLTVLVCAPMAGTYTVDPAAPLSATNFQTMNQVATALQCGISAPVVFDMAAGASFNEQVIFYEVAGASAVNTITFNGNGDTVFYAATVTGDRHTIRMDGADYFRWNDLVVQSTGGSFGFAMHLFNTSNGGCDNNMFTNCTFTVPLTSTSSAFCPFPMSGSLTSPTTAQSAGNGADSNIIDSCNIIGGYYGLTMYAPVSAPYATGNQVLNTNIQDFYFYGMYQLYQQDLIVSKCDVSRPTRATVSSGYGFYASGIGSNNLYEKNRVHDLFATNPTSTSTMYAFYFFIDASSAATSNRIENNVVDNNQGSGTHYGIYFSSANNLQVYNNTVVENYAAATGGITRGIYQAGTAAVGQDIQNNNVYISRGGTGTKHGIWLDAAAAQLTCDYNNVYMDPSMAGTNYYGENGGNQVDLTAWQASTPAVGANSASVDPIFVHAAPDYRPAVAALNNVANPALGVVQDFFDSVRSATPDIGAFEFIVPPTDISVSAILSPDTTIGCYTATDTVTVEITNSGSTTNDFVANPTVVTVQVASPGGPITLTDTINTDTLAVLGTLVVTMSPTVNMTALGTYTMNAYSNTFGDANLSNDTLATTYTYNVNLVPGTLTASPDVICASGTTDATLTGNAGGAIQWQTSPTGIAPWTNVGAGMNPHTSAVLTNTIYYRAMLSCNGAMDSTNVDTIIVNNPMVASTITDTVCGADTVTLMATSTSATINWYDMPTGGLPLDTGGSFTTYITGTDTFYAAALDGAGKMLITEVCNYNSFGAGWATPAAPVPSAVQDPIELTNIGTSPLDISGWKLEVTGGPAGSFTFPAGAIVAPNSTVVLGRGTSVGPDVAGQYYQASTLPTTSSGVAEGVILSDAGAVIQDVMAYNNYNVVGTGTPAATAADWSGSTVGGGGTAGWRRTGLDDTNDASDWTLASATNIVNYGTVNVAFTPAGCEGSRTAVIAHSLMAPAIMASADTTVCWDSTVTVPLTVSSGNAGYTYSWAPATGLDVTTGAAVNASPLTATQYIVTASDAVSGCANVDTVNVAVQEQFWDTASADLTMLCGPGSVNLAAGDSIPALNYCASGATNGFDTKIDTVSFAGVTTGTSLTVQETYTDNTAIVIPATAGVALPLSVRNGSSSGTYYGGTLWVYIDYDHSGTFDPSEMVYTFSTTAINSIPATTITIPTSALNGPTRMRFVLPESSTIQPCGTWAYGETEDYTVDISGATAVAAPMYTYTWMPGSLSGATQTVTPTASTTYTVTQTSQFGCTAQDSVVVDVFPAAVVVGNITPTTTCMNTTAVPYGSGAQSYTWTGGLTDSVAFFVTVDSTYIVTGTDSNGCMASDTVMVTAAPTSGILAQAAAANASSTTGSVNQMQSQPDGTMVSYYDASCNLISTVDDGAGGNILGNTVSTVTVESTVLVHNGEPWARRWYEITPASNGPADVTLYFTQADMDDFNAHASVIAGTHDSLPTGPMDTAGIANIRITKNDSIGLGTNPVELVPTTVTWNTTDSRWEIEIAVASFSEFRLHTANPNNTPLPVTLINFDVTKKGSVSFAAWMTASERNNSYFNLQRSQDGNAFTTLGTVNTKAINGTSHTELSYAFTDASPQIGHNYYRLEQVDQDGNMSYSRIVDVVWGADGSVVSIYPNPATAKLNVDVSIDKVAQLEVRLIDMSGRVIKSTVQQTVKGMNNVTFDLSELSAGVYGVQIYENNKLTHTSKINKQVK